MNVSPYTFRAAVAYAAILGCLFSPGLFAGETARDTWFKDARFGLFVHWGLYSIPGRGEWIYARGDWKDGEFEALTNRFTASAYRPREWARLARAAGMKYAVLTTRHHDGFCMFDSHFTDYKVTNTPYGKDAVREFAEAFRAEGLRVGFYHSLPDWTHPGYADLESPECIRGGKSEPHVPTPEQHAAFKELVYNHIHQLMTEYGRIDLLFLDYTSKTKAGLDYFGRDRILKMVRECQAEILVNDRLSFFKEDAPDFDYYTPEVCMPSAPLVVKGREVAWETCATINDHWGYFKGDDNVKSVNAIAAGLAGCVSRNGNLLLNVGPEAEGNFPESARRRLVEFADWFRVNGESITGCGRSDYTPPSGAIYTQRGNSIYCQFLQPPLGDTILPGLKGKISSVRLLRTGEKIDLVDHWGFELLKPDEQRIRTRGLMSGDVLKIEVGPSRF